MAKLSLQIVSQRIHFIRGDRVMLDFDLAKLYGVPTKVLKQSVKRNLNRFPEDFMFELTMPEATSARSGTTHPSDEWGGSRYLPYAFTEQGVAMLSSILKSERAIEVNIEIMRAFVRMKRILTEHKDLAAKLAGLEKKYDAQFRVVFDAIRKLMEPMPAPTKRRRIGLHR